MSGLNREHSSANETKTTENSSRDTHATSFGTRGSQVQILPLRPFPIRLRGACVRLVARRNPMSAILLINPANHRPRSLALNIGGKSIGGCHSAIHRHFLWSCEKRKQSGHRQIGTTEAIGSEIERPSLNFASSQSSSDSSLDRLSDAAPGLMSYIFIMIRRVTGHIMLPIRSC